MAENNQHGSGTRAGSGTWLAVAASAAAAAGWAEALQLDKLPVITSFQAKLMTALSLALFYGLAGAVCGAACWLVLRRHSGRKLNILVAAAALLPALSIFVAARRSPLPWRIVHPQHDAAFAAQTQALPNVVLVTIDTLRADALGCYGSPYRVSPELDRLSKRGSLSALCVSHAPATTPSHVSILTGVLPPAHGSRFNAVPVSAGISTLAEVFAQHGYETAAFVSAFPVTAEVSGLDRGFEIYDQYLVPDRGPQLLYRSRPASLLFSAGLLHRAERKAWMTDAWIYHWLSARDHWRPFFLWVHYYDPHLPYDPPRPWRELFGPTAAAPAASRQVATVEAWNHGQRTPSVEQQQALIRLYLGETALIDSCAGNLMRRLKFVPGGRDTRVVITADHGESLTERDYWFAHGKQLYQSSLHVPLFWTKLRDGDYPRLIDGVTPSADVFTRCLTLAGIGGAVPDNALAAYAENADGVYISAHAASANRIREKQRTLVVWPWKLVRGGASAVELYDLSSDPGEMIDRGRESEYAHIRAALEWSLAGVDPVTDGSVPPPAPLDEETLATLKSLGYVQEP